MSPSPFRRVPSQSAFAHGISRAVASHVAGALARTAVPDDVTWERIRCRQRQKKGTAGVLEADGFAAAAAGAPLRHTG